MTTPPRLYPSPISPLYNAAYHALADLDLVVEDPSRPMSEAAIRAKVREELYLRLRALPVYWHEGKREGDAILGLMEEDPTLRRGVLTSVLADGTPLTPGMQAVPHHVAVVAEDGSELSLTAHRYGVLGTDDFVSVHPLVVALRNARLQAEVCP